MDNKNILLAVDIRNALKSKDFNFLLSLFRENRFSFIDLRIFYKSKPDKDYKIENPLKYHEFWKSELPHYYLEDVIKSDIAYIFFEEYLSSEENCNNELNHHLLQIDFENFLKFFKFTKAYRYPDFLNSLNKLIEYFDLHLMFTIRDLNVILLLENRLKAEELRDNKELVQYNLLDILIAFNIFYDNFKNNNSLQSFRSYQTQIEMAIVEEISRVIILFKSEQNVEFNLLSNGLLKNKLDHIMSTIAQEINNPNAWDQDSIAASKLLLYIERMLHRNESQSILNSFICGYSDIISSENSSIVFKTNKSYRNFKTNNLKSSMEEHYFMSINSKDSNQKKASIIDTESIFRQLEFIGISEKYNCVNSDVSLRKIVEFLAHFSKYKGPKIENTYIPKTFINNPNSKFINCFGTNEVITIMKYSTLIKGVEHYFNLEKKEAEKILNYLCTDLNDKKNNGHWLFRPLIKANEHVLWLGSFLLHRRWSNIIINRFKINRDAKLPYIPKLKKIQGIEYLTLSKIFEYQVGNVFSDNQFITKCGVDFLTSDGQKGDFDVLAYKDNVLFVCEVKSGKRSDDYNEAAYYENKRLENTAAFQLEKSLLKINEDWESIVKILGLDDEAPKLENTLIYPLIVTDYFEGDLISYRNKFKKISLLELTVIFKNEKRKLLELYLVNKAMRESNNPDFQLSNKTIQEINWDLWQGNSKITCNCLINCINNNVLWKEIERIWVIDDQYFEIKY